MRGPDGVDAQLAFEDVRVKGLNRGWHGIADIGVGLMPVEAPELDLFAVKIKAVVFKSYSPEAEADAALINDPARFTGSYAGGVQHGAFQSPELPIRYAERKLFADGGGGGAALGVDYIGNDMSARARYPKPYFAQAGVFKKSLLDITAFSDLQSDLAVQSAVAEIVDNKAEGRDVEALAGVEPDVYCVLRAENDMVGDIDREGGVAAGVTPDFGAVAEYHRLMSRAVKAQQQPLAAPVLRRMKALSVTADHLIGRAVSVVVRYLLCGVRKPYGDGVFKAAVKILREKPTVIKWNIHHCFSLNYHYLNFIIFGPVCKSNNYCV